MISEFRCKEIFVAIRTHFTTEKYNYYKFGGRLKTQPKDVEFIFKKIANKYDSTLSLEEFLISAFSLHFQKTLNVPSFAGDIFQSEYFKNVNVWKGYQFKLIQMLKRYIPDKEELIKIVKRGNSLPLIVEDYQFSKIPIEILISVVISYPSIIKKWPNDPVLNEILQFANRYSTFFKKYYNVEKVVEYFRNL